MPPESSSILGILEGGTDVASMILFDPAALPDDYDVRARRDPIETIGPLSEAGDIYWLYTAADGAYSLGVCFGDRLPPEHVGFARCLATTDRFLAASGRLYFTGVEYAFRHDDSRLRKYDHMGACIKIPPGTYRLAVYEMDYPEDFEDDLLRQRLSDRDFRLYSRMQRLIPFQILGVLTLTASLFGLGLRPWFVTAFPIVLALILSIALMVRSKPFRKASEVDSAIQREYPSHWATLEPRDDQPEPRA